MNGYLRQSTAAQARTIGPFIDDADFKTLDDGLTIANTDIVISKNGAADTTKNSGGATAHGAGGIYTLTWDATDTDTVGELYFSVKVAGALVVFGTYVVLEEAIYDGLYASGAAVVPANMTQISGDATAADNLETMLDGTGGQVFSLRQLNIVNAAGSAIVASSTGSNGHGIAASGNGTGEGISATGGDTGNGIQANGGGTSGNGIHAEAASGDGRGVRVVGVGAGAGLSIQGGATANGMETTAGATGPGHGIVATGVGTGDGLSAQGGANGNGIDALAGATAGSGIRGVGAGGGNGIDGIGGSADGGGIVGTGGGAGAGLGGFGGDTGNGAAFIGGGTSGAGWRVSATVGAGAQLQGGGNGAGLNLIGAGLGSGIDTTGGPTGHGILANGGAVSGDGIHAEATSVGDGIEAVGAGGGFDINADIQGSLSGSVGSVTGNVGGNVVGSVGSVALNGISAASIAPDAIDADAIAPDAIVEIQAGLATTAQLVSEINDVQADIAALNDLSAAQVNAEVLDVLSVDTFAEPTGVPGATVSLAEKIGRLYQVLRNRLSVSSTTNKLQMYNDANAVIWEKDLTDNGTVYDESEGNAP